MEKMVRLQTGVLELEADRRQANRSRLCHQQHCDWLKKVGDAVVEVGCGSTRGPALKICGGPLPSQNVIGEIKDGLAEQLAAPYLGA